MTTRRKVGTPEMLPWAVIQHEMAAQLARLYAEIPAAIPAPLRAQPLDADSIEAWSELDVCTWWFRAYRQHADRLTFDWPRLQSENADAIEAHRAVYASRPFE